MFAIVPSTVANKPAGSGYGPEAPMNDSQSPLVVATSPGSSPPSYETGALRLALGLAPGRPFNLGSLLSDRLCQQGHGGRLALVWENHSRLRKDFTFDELRRYSDVWAGKLADLGIVAGDRVCLFLDRVPDLYFAFLGILKLGAVAQPCSRSSWPTRSRSAWPTRTPVRSSPPPDMSRRCVRFVRACRRCHGDHHRRQAGRRAHAGRR